jgi:hypothetical protein
MTNEDIENYNEEKIENIQDFVDFWARHYGIEYSWRKDDGDEYLVVWIDFKALKSFTKLFSTDTIDECDTDFQCIFRHDCIVFPHFEYILDHCDIEEEDIKKIFPI